MDLPHTSRRIVLDLISVADWYESFIKYPIPEKKTHDTRTSLRLGTFPKSRAGLGYHLLLVLDPPILAIPPPWCFTLHKKSRKKHCRQHVEIESQMSQFQKTDGSHEITK
jgi:hypothetical protein